MLRFENSYVFLCNIGCCQSTPWCNGILRHPVFNQKTRGQPQLPLSSSTFLESLPLLVVMLLLAAFQCLWAKVTAEISGNLLPGLAELASKVRPGLLVLYHQLFWGTTADDLLQEVRAGGELPDGNGRLDW